MLALLPVSVLGVGATATAQTVPEVIVIHCHTEATLPKLDLTGSLVIADVTSHCRFISGPQTGLDAPMTSMTVEPFLFRDNVVVYAGAPVTTGGIGVVIGAVAINCTPGFYRSAGNYLNRAPSAEFVPFQIAGQVLSDTVFIDCVGGEVPVEDPEVPNIYSREEYGLRRTEYVQETIRLRDELGEGREILNQAAEAYSQAGSDYVDGIIDRAAFDQALATFRLAVDTYRAAQDAYRTARDALSAEWQIYLDNYHAANATISNTP